MRDTGSNFRMLIDRYTLQCNIFVQLLSRLGDFPKNSGTLNINRRQASTHSDQAVLRSCID